MRETVPRIQRVYLRFEDAGHGMMRLAASLTPPTYDEPVMVLLSRGVMPLGQPISLLLVSDPSQVDALRGKEGDPGKAGASAYQVARAAGYGGTEAQWLATLTGAAGASAYQLARAAGYGGTMTQWLASLGGAAGKDATTLLGSITIGETATVAISAGTRRIAVATPAAWGVKVGDDLVVSPVAVPAGYATHDVTVTGPNAIGIGLTAPLLAIGAKYSIECRVRRFN